MESAKKTIRVYEERAEENKHIIEAQALSTRHDDAQVLEDHPVLQAKIQTLKAIQGQKIKSLMKSIHALKQELQHVRASDKEHKRSALIQSLRKNQREQELVIDVLKESLRLRVDEFQNSSALVNEFVIKKTVGGPKRFRPKTREEMELEIQTLMKKLALARKSAAHHKSSTAPVVAHPSSFPQETTPSKEAEAEMRELRLELRSKVKHLDHLEVACEDMKQQLVEGESIQAKCDRVQEKLRDAKDRIEALEDENLRLIEQLEDHRIKKRLVEERAAETAELMVSLSAQNQNQIPETQKRVAELELALDQVEAQRQVDQLKWMQDAKAQRERLETLQTTAQERELTHDRAHEEQQSQIQLLQQELMTSRASEASLQDEIQGLQLQLKPGAPEAEETSHESTADINNTQEHSS